MFRLAIGRHRLGAGSDRGETALRERIAILEAELARCKALAERRAHGITMLWMGTAGLFLALSMALAFHTASVRQTVTSLVQVLDSAGTAQNIDAASAAYRKGDYATALRHLRPLVDRGDARAQSMLGLLYLHGRGVPHNDHAAVHWFRLAADQGDASAQFHLGIMCAEGRGGPQDYTAAVKWYRLAADRGHAQAQYNLALSYAKGEGVSQDFVSAHMWFDLAAARFPASEVRNHELAVRNRGLVAKKMTREQIAEAQNLAREWKPR